MVKVKLKNIAFNTTARILVVVFQLINVKLYTYYLNAEQIGVFFFLLAVSYFANAALFVPVDYYQQANLSKVIAASGGALPLLKFNGRLIGFYFLFSTVLVVICEFIKPSYTSFVLVADILALFLYWVQALRNTLNNLGHGNCVSLSFIQEAVLKVLFFFILVKYCKADEILLIVAWIVSLFFSGCYLFYMAHKRHIFIGSCLHNICVREVFCFSYPFSFGAVCNWLQLQGYRLVLIPLGFAEEVGVFATLSNIGSAGIGAASLIYSQQFTPLIYNTSGQYTSKYLKGAIALIIVVALVAFGMGEFMVSILTNLDFAKHWRLLLFGVITDAANLLIGALVIHITLTGDTKKLISVSILGVVSVIMIFSLLYWFSNISIVTIGIPLLFSQWIVVLYLFSIYKFNRSLLSI